MIKLSNELTELKHEVLRLRGNRSLYPNASIVIPVNALKDLPNVPRLLSDLVHYSGRHLLEIVLVVNNYSADQPPQEIETFKQLGLLVLAIPHVEHTGGIAIAARIPGIR